jgi:tripartite-type tricarboxylate transporter receptor subunit TctC
MFNKLLHCVIAAAALAASTAVSAQASWPEKQIRLIIPFPPGGQQEVASRILVEKIAPELGQPVIVDSRPGADGNLGTEAVQKSAPDGYTWLGSSVPFTTQVALHPKSLRYNPLKDFAPVVAFGTTTFMFTVPASLPVNNLKEFVEYVKAHKGEVSYAGSGRGSVVHLATEKFKQTAGIDMVMVPYAGQPPAITDLLAGRVQFMALGSVFAAPLIKSGKLKALAVLDTKRNAELPDLPTIVEAGYPGLVLKSFFGLHVPAGTPKEVIARINAVVNKAIQSPEIIEKFAKSNVDAAQPNTPEQFGQQIDREIKLWTDIVQGAKIETD